MLNSRSLSLSPRRRRIRLIIRAARRLAHEPGRRQRAHACELEMQLRAHVPNVIERIDKINRIDRIPIAIVFGLNDSSRSATQSCKSC
jgi:hypothetical protein